VRDAVPVAVGERVDDLAEKVARGDLLFVLLYGFGFGLVFG
jgi:hypothetical protein